MDETGKDGQTDFAAKIAAQAEARRVAAQEVQAGRTVGLQATPPHSEFKRGTLPGEQVDPTAKPPISNTKSLIDKINEEKQAAMKVEAERRAGRVYTPDDPSPAAAPQDEASRENRFRHEFATPTSPVQPIRTKEGEVLFKSKQPNMSFFYKSERVAFDHGWLLTDDSELIAFINLNFPTRVTVEQKGSLSHPGSYIV